MLQKNKKPITRSTGLILDSEAHLTKTKIARLLMGAVCLLLVAVVFLPVVWMLLSAFKDTKEFLQVPPTLLPEVFDFNKVVEIWNRSAMGRAYLNSFIMTLGCVILEIFVCGFAGYVLSRLKPKGSAIVSTIAFWSIMIPGNLGTVPLYIMFVKAGLMNSFVPMWLMACTNAFHMLLYKSFFDGISISYLEAARLDGASELGIFARIVLPLSKPIFMTTTIFTFTSFWGEFFWPYLLIDDKKLQPLGVRTFLLNQLFAPDEYLMTLIFVVIPPMILFCFLQKYIMKGVNVGGIKG